MIELKHIDLPPDEALRDQIQLICVNHFAELSALPLPASNPLQALYQYVLGFELHRYFERMNEATHAKPRWVLAFDEEKQSLLGFALYVPYLDQHEACALLKLWVDPARRKQGIGSQLVQAIHMRYPFVNVACRADQAEYFVRQGFTPLRAHGPQVLLNTTLNQPEGALMLEPLEPIFSSKHAQLIQQYLLKQHGVSAMKYAYQQRDRLLKELGRKATSWVDQYL